MKSVFILTLEDYDDEIGKTLGPRVNDYMNNIYKYRAFASLEVAIDEAESIIVMVIGGGISAWRINKPYNLTINNGFVYYLHFDVDHLRNKEVINTEKITYKITRHLVRED